MCCFVFSWSHSSILPPLHPFAVSRSKQNALRPPIDSHSSIHLLLPFQITALSGRCCPPSIIPPGAACWRRSSSSRPGSGSPSGACSSCTAEASCTWAWGTKSSRSRWRDAATTRAGSESAHTCTQPQNKSQSHASKTNMCAKLFSSRFYQKKPGLCVLQGCVLRFKSL